MKYTNRIFSTVIVSIFYALSIISIPLLSKTMLKIEVGVFFFLTLGIAWMTGKKADELKFLSEKDHLTRIYNRRYVYEYCEKFKAKHESIAILLIDVNNFKAVNDQHGHEKGDRILKLIADLLVAKTAKTDIVARWGGDEFLVIVPNLKQTELNFLINSLIISVEEAVKEQHLSVPTGISVGHAIFPYDGKSLDEVLHVADQNMYKMKQA